ncbi:hypothetical protein STRTUCAR8_08025 [Streptomyces turgidiscabies Car8]|uniref:Uncharacterized protein n=2 Tax=Streptomyces TaxID=1883 RepID=L7F2W3_STRT8|nr:hypothetical protein STRTUCAR8_08025 [Streptomyces turgidiscabies Car8]
MELLIIAGLVISAYHLGKSKGYDKKKAEGCKHVIIVKEKKR